MNTSLPSGFISAIEQSYPDRRDEILAGMELPAEVSIRLNPRRQCEARPFADLFASEIPWLPSAVTGYWLLERPTFALDPLWHAGAYYVQDASAMALATVLSAISLPQREDFLALDLCAAPGGKTTILADLLPKGASLVANEILPKRAKILAENLVKWHGGLNSLVTQAAPDRLTPWLAEECDLVLVDAPCSGEGLMRREEEARRMWSLDLVMECATRQRQILREAVQMLRPGGHLIYSTCTLNRSENDEIVQWLLSEYPLELIDLSSVASQIPGALHSQYGIHLWPGVVRGEGQFLSALRLSDALETEGMRRGKKRKISTPKAIRPEEIFSWLSPHEGSAVYSIDDRIVSLPERLVPLVALAKDLRIPMLSWGVTVAEQGKKGWEPSFELVHTPQFPTEAVSRLDLPLESARGYLRGEALTGELLDGTSRGSLLLTYQGQPLGWGQQVGSRINNLYPKSYRLRMQ